MWCRYAGWGAGQLSREVKAGVWFVAAASPSLILSQKHTGPELWHHMMTLMGGEFAELSRSVRDDEGNRKDSFQEQIEAAKRELSGSSDSSADNGGEEDKSNGSSSDSS